MLRLPASVASRYAGTNSGCVVPLPLVLILQSCDMLSKGAQLSLQQTVGPEWALRSLQQMTSR